MKAVNQLGRCALRARLPRAVRNVKRAARRIFRRLGKSLGDEAPRKHYYRGYFD